MSLRVLLVSVNRVLSPVPAYPLGLDHVRAAISPPHVVRVHDLLASGPGSLAAVVREFSPDVIGVSIRNIDDNDAAEQQSFVGDACRLVAELRGLSDARIVLGGAGYSLFPRELVTRCAADYGVVGDGEQLRSLLEVLETGGDPSELPGVQRPGTGVAEPQRVAPPHELSFDGDHFAYYRDHGGVLNLETARGCPYRCAYCSYPLIQGHSLRRAEPRAVARMARVLEERGARYLFLTDSVFNADVEHSLAVAEAFRAEGVRLPWAAFFSCVATPPDYYARLRAAGLEHVEFGTDSLSDRVLRVLRKPFSFAEACAAHAQATAAGPYVAHYFTLGGPEESRETMAECLERAEALTGAVLFFFCGVRIYPGTALHQRAIEDGQVSAEQELLAPAYYQSIGITPEAVREMVEERRRGRLSWVLGAGDPATRLRVDRKRALGKVGPLWEELLALEAARQRLLG
ncbi:MAG: radical SAM protein [Polyangiaceae bacterium]|nr:radical SAM protein [Polyangiaceae bacterium]